MAEHMVEEKNLLAEAEKQLVSSLKDWIEWVNNVRGTVQNMADTNATTGANNALFWLNKFSQSIDSARTNIERITEILNAKKTSLEVKRIVVESWPRKAWIDRLAYISTALFGIGGAPFALTGGRITDASLLVAGVMWIIGGFSMAWSLNGLRKEDIARGNYFEKEFGLTPD